MFRPLIAAVALTGLAAPLPVLAETVSVTVPVHDLNLSAPADRSRLERRIQKAARQVCGVSDPRDIEMSIIMDRCYRGAIAGTRPQIAQLQTGDVIATR